MLRVVVEVLTAETVRGWALDDADTAAAPWVEVWLGDALLVKLHANLMRADLRLENIRSGRHGFYHEFDTDLQIRLRLENPGLRVVVKDICATVSYLFTHDGGHDLLPDPVPARAIFYRPHDHGQSLAYYGQSFFLDNVREYNSKLSMLVSEFTATASIHGYLAIKMYAFGDFMWWEGAIGISTPTASRFFEKLGPFTRQLIANGTLRLLFDMSNEGPPARRYSDWLFLLHKELEIQNISPLSCVLVTQNRFFEYDYKIWARENNYIQTIPLLNYDYYIAKLAFKLAEQQLPRLRSRPLVVDGARAFICLNFSHRPERTAFVGWLLGSGLIEKGWVSFGGFVNHKMDGSDFTLPSWFPEYKTAEAGIARLKLLGPLLLDLPEDTKGYTPEFDVGPSELYSKSFFSIVTESECSDGDVSRITEKAIKPLAQGHPVIIVGNPGSLRLLRQLGFKTFHPIIDESYDLFDSPFERLSRVQDEIRRLSCLDVPALEDLLSGLSSVIDHNIWHARRGLAELYRNKIEPRLLQDLSELFLLGPRFRSDTVT